MAHTPGPWEARPNDGQIVLNGSNCYDIQEIFNPHGGFNPDDIRLMAAAPELLSACKLAMSVGGTQQFYVNSIIADAIAKAEGVANAEK